MTWLLFGLATALFEAIKDLFSKRALRLVDVHIVAFATPAFALPPLLYYAFRATWVLPDTTFFVLLFGVSLLHVVAITCYIRALHLSPLSLTLPMIAFTPLFMLFTSPLMIGEVPSTTGFLGVVLIVTGAYLINVKHRVDGIFAPLKMLVKERGPVLMLLVAFIWSVSGNLDRIGIAHSNREMWMFSLVALVSLLLLPLALFRAGAEVRSIDRRRVKALLLVGLFNSLSIFFYTETISLTFIAYAVSVKRFSIVIGVILGKLFLHEENFKERILAASVMVAGVAVIAIEAGRSVPKLTVPSTSPTLHAPE